MAILFILLDRQQYRSYEKRWNCLPLVFRVLKKVGKHGKHSPRESGKTIRKENPPEGVFWFHIQCQQEHMFASEYATLSNWVSLKTDTFPYITFEFFFLCKRSKNFPKINNDVKTAWNSNFENQILNYSFCFAVWIGRCGIQFVLQYQSSRFFHSSWVNFTNIFKAHLRQ